MRVLSWLFSVRGPAQVQLALRCVPFTLLWRSLTQWHAVTRDLFCLSRCQNEVLSQPSLGRGCVWEVKHEVSPCPAILASIVHQSYRFVYVLGESASARYASKVTRGDLVQCRAEKGDLRSRYFPWREKQVCTDTYLLRSPPFSVVKHGLFRVCVCCKRVCALCDLASAHKLNLHQVLSVGHYQAIGAHTNTPILYTRTHDDRFAACGPMWPLPATMLAVLRGLCERTGGGCADVLLSLCGRRAGVSP